MRGQFILCSQVLKDFWPLKPPKNQKSQQLVPAGKVFGLLGFLILFLVTHRCHGAPIGFPGKKTQHRALCVQEIGD
ncbi:hypothetical protein [Vibrio campbellii]|uniref:hypothetical protein n=1 Tax=Vibrio campbellii TaxID=680 RepID=UPI0038577EA4